jgi:lysophospholipase L1-like esterase
MTKWIASGSGGGGASTAALNALKLASSARIRSMAASSPAAPPTMTSPPTVAQTATATAALTKTVSVGATGPVRWGTPFLKSTPTVTGTVQPRGYTAPNAVQYDTAFTTTLSFDTDAEQFDFSIYARSTLLYRIWVNEQAVTSGLQTSTSTNAQSWINVNFGSASVGNPRRIIIELEDLTNPINAYNIKVGPTRTVMLPQITAPRVMWVGDSYGIGNGTSHQLFAYPRSVCRLLGWADSWNSMGCMGGTGFVTDADPTYVGHYATRLTPDVIPSNPDLIVLQGSINDPSDSTLTTAFNSYMTTLRASLPNVPVVVTSPLYVATPAGGMATINTTLKAAVNAAGLPYVDVMGAGVFTGTGKAGGTTGDGNADVYRASDGTHPTDDGHFMLAHAMAGGIAQALGLPYSA